MSSTRLNLDTEFMSVKNIYNTFLKENIINLNPEYQRDFSWNEEQINLFIDSLINGYIVPSIVLLEKEDEEKGFEYECVDGQHRLNVIKRFIENKLVYKIKKESTQKSFHKIYYNDGEIFCNEKNNLKLIDKIYKKSFDSAKIPIFIIKNIDNEQIIRDIFIRLQNGSKVSMFGKLKNKKHPLLDFIRENTILNNYKIKKLANILYYEIKFTEEENGIEQTSNKICERKQKHILFMLAKLIYLYKNKEKKEFSVDSLNINMNIEKYLTNNSPNMMFSLELIEEFYDKFETFISFLNYNGDIYYKEYMLLILWKFYINNCNNNFFKFSLKYTIDIYNNEKEFILCKPDNKNLNIIYQKYNNNETDLLS
jgi:hypothetical protein